MTAEKKAILVVVGVVGASFLCLAIFLAACAVVGVVAQKKFRDGFNAAATLKADAKPEAERGPDAAGAPPRPPKTRPAGQGLIP